MSGVPAFRLVEAGFSQSQVEALTEFMEREAARRIDLMEVKAELKADISAVRAELKDTKIDMIKWMIGIAFAQTGLILAVIKLFAH